MTLLLDSNSIQLMEDLKAHQDETVQIVLTGTGGIVHFELTGAMKDGILKLYTCMRQPAGPTRPTWTRSPACSTPPLKPTSRRPNKTVL